ncbi:MAG: VCBS repeat-containing protein [Ignavibacteria bacterium]|nr:VCBS repeat-containing protein [Ignavibacteria bacterium]
MNIEVNAQAGSPANWLYPNGNMEATHSQSVPSLKQSVDSIVLKWSTVEISGDVQPLIGNIKENPKILSSFLWSPNEIAAVIKDHIVVIDGTGKLLTRTPLPGYVKHIRGISVLYDSNAVEPITNTSAPVVMGLETIESESNADSLIYSYIAGFSTLKDSVILIKGMSINVGKYDPNLFGSVTPVLGRNFNGQGVVYATVNMSSPVIPSVITGDVPYFRGLTQFNTNSIYTTFPLPDVKDLEFRRLTLGPEISLYPPSIATLGGGRLGMALPVLPSRTISELLSNPITSSTYGNRPYLMSFEVQGSQVNEGIAARELTSFLDTTRNRPLIRPYYVKLSDGGASNTENWYVLVSEEYKGIDSSLGGARLHLYNTLGDPITTPNDLFAPPFNGGKNHYWSVGVGDVDGSSNNELLPYFPNNPGSEIVVTQSSKEFAYPGSKLFILRWRTGLQIEKITKPGTFLFQFDTIASSPMNGWVAAVNDIDGGVDKKEEIFVVDRSNVSILRLRDYSAPELRLGNPFDTIRVFNFPNETITSLEIADLEGDGANDIIITTMNRTYVYGKMIPGSLHLFTPKIQLTPSQEYCIGDSVNVRWTNLMKGQDKVHIFFERYQDTLRLNQRDTFLLNLLNTADSLNYNFRVDSSHIGTEGRIIIQSANSVDLKDSSAIIRFPQPKVIITSPRTDSMVTFGSTLAFQGVAACLDSLWLQYRNDSTWIVLQSMVTQIPAFSFITTVPCLPIIPCDSTRKDSTMGFRVIGKSLKTQHIDTSAIFLLKVIPASISITVDPPPAIACPSRNITWDALSIPTNIFCDTINVYVSIDSGKTFREIDHIPITQNGFEWDVPVNLRDSSAILRLCCANGCIRTDTLVKNIKVRYISLVSPNPFAPPDELAQIIYTVPNQTNVTVRIYDQANRLVAEPVTNEPRLSGIAYCDHWDGITRKGIVANGMYYVSIELSDGTREVYPLFVKKK